MLLDSRGSQINQELVGCGLEVS